MAVVLDAGALIAADRRDRRVGAMLRVAQRDHLPVRTSAGAVAQAWRNGSRQAHLARVLTGVETLPIDPAGGRRMGELLGRSDTADVVDGHVALLTGPGDTVVTSDPDDLRHLLDTRGVSAAIVVV